ncbi:MAG: hypothetical protein AAFX92_04900 [Pseudomonadota bacterium]
MTVLVCLAVVASCADRPTEEQTPTVVEAPVDGVFGGVPYSHALDDLCIVGQYFVSDAGPPADEIGIVQRSNAVPLYTPLPTLEADEYTVFDSAVPGFEIFSAILEPSPYPSRVVVTAMNHPDKCRWFSEFLIDVDPPEAVDIERVDDWLAVAGADAVDALRRIRAECVAMSREEAVRTFGAFGFRAANGAIVAATTHEEACTAATQARSYALRITSPVGAVIVSNVFGEIFVEAAN